MEVEFKMKRSPQSLLRNALAVTLLLALTVGGVAAPAEEIDSREQGNAGRSIAVSTNGTWAKIHDGRIKTSSDGKTWSVRSIATPTYFRAITYGKDVFVAVGGSYFDEPGVILTSRDGITWTRRNTKNRINLYSVAWGDGLFVAVGDEGTIFTSKDAGRWTRQCSGTSVLLATVVFGNSVFVAGGESGTILVSTNGTDWRAGNIGNQTFVGTIAVSDGLFVVERCGATFVSSEGLDWHCRKPGTSCTNWDRKTL
jgi:photosystem II stability/assembly factor-like uncharacterized protein